MSKQFIDAKRTDAFILDPATMYIAGLDTHSSEDPNSVLKDTASNAVDLPDSFVSSFGEIVRVNKITARAGEQIRGNTLAIRAARVECDLDDPYAHIGKGGNSCGYRIEPVAGRKRVRGARAWNKLNNLTPEHEDYAWIVADMMSGKMTPEQAVVNRLIENLARLKHDPVEEGKEIKRLALELARAECNASSKKGADPIEPTKKQISAQMRKLAALRNESKNSVDNKAALADLSPVIQEKIVGGDIKPSGGYELAKLRTEDGPDFEAQCSVVQELEAQNEENNKLKTADIKTAVANRNADPNEAPRATRLGMKALRALAAEYVDTFPAISSAFALAAGDMTEQAFRSLARELLASSSDSAPVLVCDATDDSDSDSFDPDALNTDEHHESAAEAAE